MCGRFTRKYTWRELWELYRLTSPASNLVWADRHGSIGYKLVGRLPRRPGGCPDLPKPGWSGEFEWDGTIPYDELPEVVDPESGFLVTANNRIVGDDYPHHITSEWLDGFRANAEPDARLACGPIWRESTIDHWVAGEGRERIEKVAA